MCDALAGECLLPESFLDAIEDLGMCSVVLVQHVLELEVRPPKVVAEVLREGPSAL